MTYTAASHQAWPRSPLPARGPQTLKTRSSLELQSSHRLAFSHERTKEDAIVRQRGDAEWCDSEMSVGGGCELAGNLQQPNSPFDPCGPAPSGYTLTMLVDNCHCLMATQHWLILGVIVEEFSLLIAADLYQAAAALTPVTVTGCTRLHHSGLLTAEWQLDNPL
ncbi:unnamed protein product [Pleuronectes platessa]|uniref:Uncharacterized protein n=1 Tax=Pleuronectes platessa TaxID=8262 RepID=A0A9N7VA04_PLEPL|nr:unnamed protein product [Pleuronectes platessa]